MVQESPQRFQVGIKDSAWVLITDGIHSYIAEEDIRHFSRLVSAHDRQGFNKISELEVLPTELPKYCAGRGIILRGPANRAEKSKKIIGPASIGGTIGALIGGPIGAVIGAGALGYLNSSSDFEEEKLRAVFKKAKRDAIAWIRAERSLLDYEAKKRQDDEVYAQNSWKKYYRLRNVRALDELTGIEFEIAVKEIYVELGYSVQLTPQSNDYGVDLLATKGNKTIAIQAKRYAGAVGVKAVQEAVAGAQYYKANGACVVTNSFFSKNAETLASDLKVHLIDRQKLMSMWVKAFPEDKPPEFDNEKFEEQKEKIIKALSELKRATPRHRRRN